MARLTSVHRSAVTPAHLLDFQKGRDGLLGGKGNSGAGATSLRYSKENAQTVSGLRAFELPPYNV